jgi:hypothetical protein
MNAIARARAACRKVPLLAWLASGLLLLAGILLLTEMSPSGPTVTGLVQLEGQPLLEGRIKFVPEKGTAGSGGGDVIRKGKYRIEKGLTVGKYQVEIRADRPIPGKKVPSPIGGPPIDRVVPIVFAELDHPIRQVGPGLNTHDFELKEKEVRKRP